MNGQGKPRRLRRILQNANTVQFSCGSWSRPYASSPIDYCYSLLTFLKKSNRESIARVVRLKSKQTQMIDLMPLTVIVAGDKTDNWWMRFHERSLNLKVRSLSAQGSLTTSRGSGIRHYQKTSREYDRAHDAESMCSGGPESRERKKQTPLTCFAVDKYVSTLSSNTICIE